MNDIHLASVDLNLLVVLDALLKSASVSETARRIGRTQSAVSHALGRLRATFDDPLLVRAGTRMTATPRARELAGPLAHALRQVEGVFAMPGRFDAARLKRRFVVGTSDFHELVVLAPLVRALCREAPGVDLHSVNVGDDVEERTRSGELDMAVAVSARHLAGLASLPLFDEEFRVVMRRGHPLARAKLTLPRYVRAQHALVAPRGRPGSRVDAALRARGLERRVVLRLGNFVTAPFLIAHTDLLVTLPARIANALAPRIGLVIRNPPLALPGFTVSLIYSHAFENDPGHRWLRQCFARAVHSPSR